jgi:hypothetical protein
MSQRHPIPRRASLPPQEWRTTQAHPLPRQAMRQTSADVWNEDEEPEERATRLPTSARRYTAPADRQLAPVPRQPEARPTKKRQRHPLFYIGVGMLAACAAATLLVGPVGTWWTDWRNYTDYGNPRTFQTDAIVGQQDSPGHPSHFIALNLRGQLIVIEFPGGDPSKGRDFVITTISGPNASGVPVTLSFADVNGDGKPDMLIRFEGQQVIYLNDHGTFRPAKPGEVTTNG